MNFDVFDPCIDFIIAVAFKSTHFSLEILVAFVNFELIAVSFDGIRITFDEEDFAFLEVRTDQRKSFPAFEYFFLFFIG